MMAINRLHKELKDIKSDPVPYCAAGMGDDIFHWNAVIEGPEDTPYAGGIFRLAVRFPPRYPLSPPKVEFKTKVYHPNVDNHGAICLNILSEDWSPTLPISKVLLSIYVLLADPNPYHPMIWEIGDMYLNDKAKFDAIARTWTEKYAKPATFDELDFN